MHRYMRFDVALRIACLSVICVLAAVPYSAAQQNDRYDLVITGGRVLDGTGEQLHAADIAVQNGKIVEVGYVQKDGKRTIDARGYWVTPGFIDMRSRSSANVLQDESDVSDLYHGITLAILSDGASEGESAGRAPASQSPTDNPAAESCKSLGDYLDGLQKKGIALNLASYVSASHVWDCVMGRENRRPNKTELQEMTRIVAQSMQEGALGLSNDTTGVSAEFFNSEDMTELAKAARARNGLFSTRLSASGSSQLTRLQECLRIAEGAKTGIQIEDLGALADIPINELIEALTSAKQRGVDVGADLALPSSPSKRSEEGIVQLMKLPWVSFGSSGPDRSTDRQVAGNVQTAPFGPFLNLIGTYAREKKALTPWEMVYRMTWMPAKRLNLKDRGRIAPGMAADLVIFKPETISDHPAAYNDPSARSTGVQWLIVNGEVAVDGGKYTGARAGRVLRGSVDAQKK
jgi:N-acyl-D-amino-acid deacylase